MLKKVTTVLSSQIRQKLDDDRELALHKGLRAAIKLPTQIANYCIFSVRRRLHADEGSCDFPKGMTKFFNGESFESDWLKDIFEKTTRIAAFVSLFIHDTVQVEVHFYQGGRGQKPAWLKTTFDKDGNCGCIGYVDFESAQKIRYPKENNVPDDESSRAD